MGVSIGWKPVPVETNWLSVGARSRMYTLLLDNNLCRQLGVEDIPTLLMAGRTQMKGKVDPPFDYSIDIQKAFQELARAIRKYGGIVIVCEF